MYLRVYYFVSGGKMCVQITLQSELSTDMVSIYLKRWRLQQYPAGLVNGVTVCVTDVNIKKSKHEKTYFISTPFTRIVYLDTDHNERYSLFLKHFIYFFKFY